LQHEDGHSQLIANVVPNLRAYDPAYAYELAVIIRDGLSRMLERDEDVFYYVTLYNEAYLMPEKPADADDGIIAGLYRLRAAPGGRHRAQLFGSGPLLRGALRAQEILAERYDVAATVWSVTSYQQLFRDGRAAARFNRLHPTAPPQVPYLTGALAGATGPVIAVSDWVEEVPSLVARFVPNRFVPLGTNGFGRSDTREALRRHFEVDAAHVVASTLVALAQDGVITAARAEAALRELQIDTSHPDPIVS
jgi:pyruvate dehydrogenase E1 component